VRQNNEGPAVGGPADGETLSFWKNTIPESSIDTAMPFSSGVNARVVNVDRAHNRGSYEWSGETKTWIWEKRD